MASGAFVGLLHAGIILAAIWATRRESVAQPPPILLTPDGWLEPLPAPRRPAPVGPWVPPDMPELALDGVPDAPILHIGPDTGRPLFSVTVPPSGGQVWEGGALGVLSVTLVEERPELLSGPAPHYPEWLRRLGVTGRVTVDVVLDTLGRVEPGSLAVVETVHPGLVDPVRQALGRALFRPARVHGRAVRVLVRIPFEFRIAR